MRTYPDQLAITPLSRSFDVTLRPPGSKSLTNRALLLAALAEGDSTLDRPLIADDTLRMLGALDELGFHVTQSQDNRTITVAGQRGTIPSETAALHLGNAGTAMRSLTGACCLGHGTYELDGIARMRQRPIDELVAPLRELGADISYLGNKGFPPLLINANGMNGGTLTLKSTLSSQFITALLIAAPYFDQGLTIHFEGPITSWPYVQMTLQLMRHFGIDAQLTPDRSTITVAHGHYTAADYAVEPDASSASYFLAAAAAIPNSRCVIAGLTRDSLQGDHRFIDVLTAMNANTGTDEQGNLCVQSQSGTRLRGFDLDLNAIPDAAMTGATLAVLADGPTTIRNVGNWRVKETDRMHAMQTELTKAGASVTVTNDDITIVPPADGQLTAATIDTYDDHRMAMSFAILGLAQPGITLNDPGCVAKTYPGFFDDLDQLRASQETGS